MSGHHFDWAIWTLKVKFALSSQFFHTHKKLEKNISLINNPVIKNHISLRLFICYFAIKNLRKLFVWCDNLSLKIDSQMHS